MDKRIIPIKNLDAVDGTIYGKSNKVNMVNPYKSYFIVQYSDGTIQKGNNLFDTGWNKVRHGVASLKYKLSTGHLITIPKMKGYLPTIEVSESIEGFKLFHAIHVNCIAYDKILKYKIILKEDNISRYKIGDIIISESDKGIESSQWKMSE